MIFRKPYAFFIKYFRLIHFILSSVAIYVAYRTYNIINFFNDYIVHDYSGNFYKGFYNSYISSFLYLMIVLIIIGTILMVILFIYKKKPIKAYFSCVIYYIFFLVLLYLTKNMMITLESEVITAEAARVYRDLSLLSIIPQVYFILLFILRGLGLNLGRFNFQEDLKELEISEQDNEEVEINFKNDSSKFQRKLRRFFREFNYYIKENKFIVIVICVILVGVLSVGIYKILPKNYDSIYKQGESFTMGNLTYKIEDSIITNINNKGDLLEKDAYYIVAKLYIENTSKEEITIDYNSFRLQVNDTYVYPTTDKGLNFIDYAINNIGNKIKPNSKGTYSLVYKIKSEDKKDNYQIKINNGSIYIDNKAINKYNYITITPIVINEINLESKVLIGEKILFTNSNLGNSNLIFNNPIITTKYTYDYEFCLNNKCNTYKDIINLDYAKNDKILIIMDYEYNLDKNVPFYSYSHNIKQFVDNFIKVRYLENDKYVYSNVKEVTPNNLKNKVVLETTNKIKNNKDIDISIIIRNKEYVIDLN